VVLFFVCDISQEKIVDKELVMYARTAFCPDVMRAVRFLDNNNIPYRRIDIDRNEQAAGLVESLVGHRSVPTLVIANKGESTPFAQPASLGSRSARSVDRGSVITEPSDEALSRFLERNGVIGATA
jgi:glutaredoxin